MRLTSKNMVKKHFTEKHRVLGKMMPDPISAMLHTDFMRFESKYGIQGLATINGGRLVLLAINATAPGSGQFRKFISVCKENFDTIEIWEVMNVKFGQNMIAHYDFRAQGVYRGSQIKEVRLIWQKNVEVVNDLNELADKNN